MKKFLNLALILLAITIASCGKDKEPTKEEPILSTLRAISSFSPASGTVGQEVTIVGMGFGSNSNQVTIQFGESSPTKPKSVVDGQIVVIVPSFAKTGQIKVVVNGTDSMTSRQTFTLL